MAVPFFLFFQGQQIIELPRLTFKAILTFAGRDTEGQLVEAAADPWFAIIRMIQRDPGSIYRIDWRDWEEIVAGGWRQDDYDVVTLTPRSGDKGRDVIATKHGVGSIRILAQVKAYNPERVVTAEEALGSRSPSELRINELGEGRSLYMTILSGG
ncbi:MAG: restriction endonuclease [Acidobacteria bacterium]|nr:restriction endonuclease [Acidobacteriota bacterium]